MKNILYFIAFISLSCCNSKQLKNKLNLSKADSLNLEKTLIDIKNYNFKECYSLSEINTYKRMGVDLKDTCNNRVNDLTMYYYNSISNLDLNLIAFDKNREKLIKKWVNKEGYIPFVNPPDFPDGSLDMVRALDFYNSEDLRLYIDSIRQVEIKNILSKR